MNRPDVDTCRMERRDWVIQIDDDGPMFVNEDKPGGFVRNITDAESFSTANEARENMYAFIRNNPGKKCWVKPI
jgi:hypothetical protein